MDRRRALQFLGLGALTAAVDPKLLAKPLPKPEPLIILPAAETLPLLPNNFAMMFINGKPLEGMKNFTFTLENNFHFDKYMIGDPYHQVGMDAQMYSRESSIHIEGDEAMLTEILMAKGPCEVACKISHHSDRVTLTAKAAMTRYDLFRPIAPTPVKNPITLKWELPADLTPKDEVRTEWRIYSPTYVPDEQFVAKHGYGPSHSGVYAVFR